MKKLILPLEKEHPLVRWANPVAGFYGHHLYLVGSQITGSETPRDVDVICVLPDREFELRYGSVEKWIREGETGFWTDVRWKWAADCTKKSLHGMQVAHLQIDFKVLPESHHIVGWANINKQFPPIQIDIKP